MYQSLRSLRELLYIPDIAAASGIASTVKRIASKQSNPYPNIENKFYPQKMKHV